MKYRPDIEDLRAVAIIPVVLFHAGLGMSGGFVGVDVFVAYTDLAPESLATRIGCVVVSGGLVIVSWALTLIDLFQDVLLRVAPTTGR